MLENCPKFCLLGKFEAILERSIGWGVCINSVGISILCSQAWGLLVRQSRLCSPEVVDIFYLCFLSVFSFFFFFKQHLPLSFEELLPLTLWFWWSCPVAVSVLLSLPQEWAYGSHWSDQNPCRKYKPWGWRSSFSPLGLWAVKIWSQNCLRSERGRIQKSSDSIVCVPGYTCAQNCLYTCPLQLC